MNGKQQAVIVSAVRTPMGSFNGIFSSVPATKLGSIAIAEALKRIRVAPGRVDDVYMGCVLSAGLGQAPARQASMGAGIPNSVGAITVNKVCGSSIQTVIMASQAIALGEAKIVVAGGMENMTRAPYLLEKARQGYRLGHAELVDSLIKDGLWDVYNNFHMGNAGELCAAKYQLAQRKSTISPRKVTVALSMPLRPEPSSERSCRWTCHNGKAPPSSSQMMKNRIESI